MAQERGWRCDGGGGGGVEIWGGGEFGEGLWVIERMERGDGLDVFG